MRAKQKIVDILLSEYKSGSVFYSTFSEISYEKGLDLQKELFRLRKLNKIPDIILLLQHPPTFTIGKSGARKNILLSSDLLQEMGIKVFRIGRGGDVTAHNRGQLVVYPIIDIKKYCKSVPEFINFLEEVIIKTLSEFDIIAGRKNGYPGVWIGNRKIAAIGIKLSRYVSMHGIALNVKNDLSLFNFINPCGIEKCQITSIENELLQTIEMEKVIEIFLKYLSIVFHFDLQALILIRNKVTIKNKTI